MRALSLRSGARPGSSRSFALGVFVAWSLSTSNVSLAARGPRVVISIAGATLRLDQPGVPRRVFPVAVGRRTEDGLASPLGLFRTGRDPDDRRFYEPSRRAPAFHRGLPFIRIDLPTARRHRGQPVKPYGIHGPVTPTLIWGAISAGCVRMRPAHIRALYRVAVAHPGMSVRFVRGADPVAERLLARQRRARRGRCAEAELGARRLIRVEGGSALRHDRICGGVDHWYGLTLQGGQLLSVELGHDGSLAVELYGLRAISAVSRGARGLRFRVPAVPRNRGARYLRVYRRAGAKGKGKALQASLAYTLRVRRL